MNIDQLHAKSLMAGKKCGPGETRVIGQNTEDLVSGSENDKIGDNHRSYHLGDVGC